MRGSASVFADSRDEESIKGVAMKKRILKFYAVAGILFLFLIVHGLFKLRVSGLESFYPRYDALTHFSVATARDDEAPRGEKIIMSGRIRNVKTDYNTLVFYSIHQNVRVYLNSECIYSVEAVPGILTPGSPGRIINQIQLSEEANGKYLRIELIPLYSGTDTVPELLLGNRYDIVEYIVFANIFTLLLCGASILIGVGMILYAFPGKNKGDGRRRVGFFGCFSIMIGIWKAFDCSIFGFVSIRLPAVSLVPFFALVLFPIMAVRLIRSVIPKERSFIWDIPDLVSIFSIALLLFLQISGISDYWQNLWIVQLCLLISVICVIGGLIELVKQHGWEQNVKNGLICSGCCLLWMVADMVSYYGKRGIESFPLSMLVFLAFLIFIAVERLRLSRARMEVGMQARQYRKLAYHDALTGFFNKAAYMEHIASEDFFPQKNVMVAFDLNNLKRCNDELGHDKGDMYIKESARIIMDCFGHKGRCYRLGGDEFGVILDGADLEACRKCAERMKEKVQKYNENSEDIRMGIACGYAVFDPQEDEDINATVRRADKMMYEEKFRMKQLMS